MKIVTFYKALMVSVLCAVSVACSAGTSDEEGSGSASDVSDAGIDSSSERCNFLKSYALTIQGNFEAQKMAGTQDPLAATKSWVDYEDAEVGSPGKVYFDSIFQAVEAGAPPAEVQRQAIAVCSKYTNDQLDQANFFLAVQ